MGKPLKGLEVLRVLRHPALLRLWLAQIIYLSVQFTASYAMIVLITDETHSATLVGLVIIALSLPLVLFGAPAGALVDRLDRRRILWISNAVRALSTALFVVALLFDSHQYLFIYALAFLFSLVGLFFSPAEGAIIPRLVGESELLPALSLYNLTLNASQAVGLLLLGPLALDLLPPLVLGTDAHHLTLSPVETLFIILTGLYLIAAGLTASLPRERQKEKLVSVDLPTSKEEQDILQGLPLALESMPVQVELPVGLWKRLHEDLVEGWQLVRQDALLLDGLWQACFGGLIMLTIAELATTFVQRLLNLPTSDTALIFAPAGIGLVAGSLLVPAIVSFLGSTRTIITGMLGTALGIGLLPVAQGLARLSDPTGWWTNPLFLLTVAGLTALAGFCLDLIVVPAQTRMQERSPDEIRGRVLALYQVLFNGGAIPVMLFMGALTDLLGIGAVIDMLVACSLAGALLTLLRSLARRRHGPGGGAPEGLPKEQGHPAYRASLEDKTTASEPPALSS
ncbi:MAG TPA: MFS transporter [Ktedonobacterales bacterium]|nr:MFS transporter [Ktedonobacterales bacterium]